MTSGLVAINAAALNAAMRGSIFAKSMHCLIMVESAGTSYQKGTPLSPANRALKKAQLGAGLS